MHKNVYTHDYDAELDLMHCFQVLLNRLVVMSQQRFCSFQEGA